MTTRISEFFDALFFTESTFGKPSLAGDTLIIPVMGVLPLDGYPISGERHALKGRMIFTGVDSSTRTVTEYIGNPTKPDGFKDPYEVTDVDRDKGTSALREYAFEGVSEDPMAWIDNWSVWAESFEFEVEQNASGSGEIGEIR